MTLLRNLKQLVKDPGPEYAFEISEAGLAWTTPGDAPNFGLAPFLDGELRVNPIEPNFHAPGTVARVLREAAPPLARPHPRLAVLVLPDYCARVAVLDFDSFPALAEEQSALVRFRIKRTVPFDIEGALIACHPQPRRDGSKKIDVVAVAISREISEQYTSPFRAAGFQCGLITISGLAALSLEDSQAEAPAQWMQVKRAGRVLSVCLVDRGALRLFRCVELDHASVGEMVDILGPTLAYAEDELGARPSWVRLCGFPPDDRSGEAAAEELGLPAGRAHSQLGAAGAANSGLLGLLATGEVN